MNRFEEQSSKETAEDLGDVITAVAKRIVNSEYILLEVLLDEIWEKDVWTKEELEVHIRKIQKERYTVEDILVGYRS